jgi:hypothetical protein
MNISENNKTNFDNKKPCLFHHSRVSRPSALAYIHVYDTDNQQIEQK